MGLAGVAVMRGPVVGDSINSAQVPSPNHYDAHFDSHTDSEKTFLS